MTILNATHETGTIDIAPKRRVFDMEDFSVALGKAIDRADFQQKVDPTVPFDGSGDPDAIERLEMDITYARLAMCKAWYREMKSFELPVPVLDNLQAFIDDPNAAVAGR